MNDINLKKCVKMKGIRKPRIIACFIGWIHNRKGLVWQDDSKTKVTSFWLDQKQKDFDSYMAELYKVTGSALKDFRIERDKVQDQLICINEKISVLKSEVLKEEPETIAEKRRQEEIRCQISFLEEEYWKTIQKLKEIKIIMENSEHETQELLQTVKSKVEALMLAYIQGAKKYSKTEILLHLNEVSIRLYKQYCNNFDYIIDINNIEEKEDENYAI